MLFFFFLFIRIIHSARRFRSVRFLPMHESTDSKLLRHQDYKLWKEKCNIHNMVNIYLMIAHRSNVCSY